MDMVGKVADAVSAVGGAAGSLPQRMERKGSRMKTCLMLCLSPPQPSLKKKTA